ncbi:hypothetical protein FQN50_002458 [Emmonsiellopsis sp. PD_5]|nr:hypothetical protein FQN50_002458 [Emmonsiellopsis sp. PD_5]
MQLTTLSTFLTLLLPLTTLATPIPSPDGPADISLDDSPALAARHSLEARGKKSTRYCDIVNVDTKVDCWRFPAHGHLDFMGNKKVTSFSGKRKNIKFTCYVDCEDIHGNTSWDYAANWGCYVPGYYTDSKCTRKALGKCKSSAYYSCKIP